MSRAQKQRVAVLVESASVPAWLAALVSRLEATEDVDLDVVAIGRRRPPVRATLLARLYARADRTLFRWRPDALARARIRARSGDEQSLEAPDVVLDFASARPEALARGVPDGVWTVEHGPVGSFLYELRIRAWLENGSQAIVYSSCGALDPASPHRTVSQTLWKAQGAFAHRLRTVRRLGRTYLDSRPRDHGRATADQPMTSRAIACQATRAAVGVIGRRLRKLRERELWFIAARSGSTEPLLGVGDRLGGFVPLELSGVADPFVLDDDGDTYLFFEEEDADAGRAHISFLRLGPDARPLGPPATSLAAPYHLSYPFVFRHEGAIFMIPESSENRTVELYRAASFPTHWELEAVLLRGVYALDATVLVHDSRLWLFASVAEEGAGLNDELHLYSSSSLAGPWAPHPLNPVVTDVRSARPAGRIFRDGGALIRPSQDCSRRYGYALVFNRIDVLTDKAYVETPVGRLEPGWLPGVVATHTYNAGTRVEVIDGKRIVRASPVARRVR